MLRVPCLSKDEQAYAWVVDNFIDISEKAALCFPESYDGEHEAV